MTYENQESVSHFLESDPEMNQMLRLTDENFKVTIITILSEVKHSMFSVNKTLRRQTNKPHQRKWKKGSNRNSEAKN